MATRALARRYISLKLGERIISVLPGDEIVIHENTKIELLPGYSFSGMTISHRDHCFVMKFAQFARIKTSLDYIHE